jgi:hypothetical protein
VYSRQLGSNDYSPFSGPPRDNLTYHSDLGNIRLYLSYVSGPNLCFIPLRSDCVCLTLYNPYESLSSYFVCVHSQVLFVAKFIIPPNTNPPIFLSRNHTLSLNTIFIHPSAYSQATRNLIQGFHQGNIWSFEPECESPPISPSGSPVTQNPASRVLSS